jgi:hypothetical protein
VQSAEETIWTEREGGREGGKKEGTGAWVGLHKERHISFASTNIIRVVKSRRMSWARH